ncbi:cytochrome b/b6 domain-containing protein [Microbacterium sp. PA5]|uniref:cytochrome b/b6 domain-containing protein n=1 Tax=Microbacterium sp. PA5 TaxID=3416654 RepID=UPI003CF325CB
MATRGPGVPSIRRGLPRRPGGESWPPAGVAPEPDAASEADAVAGPGPDAVPAAPPVVTPEQGAAPSDAALTHDGDIGTAAPAGSPVALRRGLPRTPGGDAWPPARDTAGPAATPAPAAGSAASSASAAASTAPAPAAAPTASASAASAPAPSTAPTAPDAPDPVAADADADAADTGVRRGLPRVAGGAPWPALDIRIHAPRPAAPSPAVGPAGPIPAAAPAAPSPTVDVAASEPTVTAAAPATVASPGAVVIPAAERMPLTAPRTVWPGRAAFHRPPAKPEPTRVGPFTRGQWAGALLVGGAGLLVVAAMAVALVRVVLSLPAMQDFLAAYPGEYHLPESAPVGIPAWIGWQHFFNAFFMLLIIRTGLQIRTEKRPAVFWTPRRNKKGKTSLTIWFHQALDLLWLVNGAVFVVLLFATGQWMRIVPTSWEVFPNALSAALQYVSLDWPTENGWVNYNSLQQLAYFSTVFLAAPLAAITGFRMSAVWPKKSARLSAAYPIEWARKVHFPVMLYFVAFIIVHVALVFATGALRNLNHMYAAQGSVDGVAYADNWTGFWIFVASVAVMAGGWIAARPLVIAPIAKLFGTVSGR